MLAELRARCIDFFCRASAKLALPSLLLFSGYVLGGNLVGLKISALLSVLRKLDIIIFRSKLRGNCVANESIINIGRHIF